MSRSRKRPSNRRYIAVFAALAVTAALVTVTQVAGAQSRRGGDQGACPTPAPSATGAASPTAAAAAAEHDHGDGTETAADAAKANADATNADAAPADATDAAAEARTGAATEERRRRCNPSTGPTTGPSGGTGTAPTAPPVPPAPIEIIGNSCEDSGLEPHDGFQLGNKCVSTAFGEVGEAANNPTLLITQAPLRVRVNRAFTIQVSTRNLVRDRFLPAKDGGYYKESAYLTEEGLVHGHFHTACRMLTTRRSAPDPAPVPVFFAATEDSQGGAEPDVVTVTVPAGLPATGIAQCAAWAGDGSHRVPMMQRANQIPAFDSVRIIVTR